MDESPDRPERSAHRIGAVFAILAAAIAVLAAALATDRDLVGSAPEELEPIDYGDAVPSSASH
jgi:hypothetical protein